MLFRFLRSGSTEEPSLCVLLDREQFILSLPSYPRFNRVLLRRISQIRVAVINGRADIPNHPK
ncbi:MAG TPA: hypothetical protein DCX37_07730, partial [Firmicutes bacterium]|nr:hypothetical protein [Bacillota bacterium]